MIIAVGLWLVPLPEAWAHKSGVSYSDVDVGRAESGAFPVDYTLRLCSHTLAPLDRDRNGKISNAEVALQRGRVERVLLDNVKLSSGGVDCPLAFLGFSSEAAGDWVAFKLAASCPGTGPLKIEYLLLATDQKPGYNLARINAEGGYQEFMFTMDETALVLDQQTILGRRTPPPWLRGHGILLAWLATAWMGPVLSLLGLMFLVAGKIPFLLAWLGFLG